MRNLVESGNKITLALDKKEIKSSQTLQIIQSRLAYKQQMYTEALLRNKKNEEDAINNNEETSSAILATSPTYLSPIGSFPNKFGYTSDEDNESFVSADSVIWFLKKKNFRIQKKIKKKTI